MTRARLSTLVLLLFVAAPVARPQQAAPSHPPSEIAQNIRTSFSFPVHSWWEKPASAHDFFASKLSESISFNEPLQPATTPAAGLGSQGDRGSTSRNLSASVKYAPLTFWFAQATFDAYFQPRLQRPWNPDFTYSFGYDDWHPYTFSLTYANYGGNRFSPNRQRGESVSQFLEGGVTLGWKFRVPLKIERPWIEPRGARFGWATNYTVSPNYGDLASGHTMHWKQSASLTCTNTVYKFFYWTATAIRYPYGDRQQPWDPDYTYGFGYFDYRRGKFSVEYNNYAGNRYPWRSQGKTPGTFRSGGVSIMWNLP